jgi:hypothetical protein
MLRWIVNGIGRLAKAWTGRYRPERHYMRGAGPATRRARG